MERLTDPAQGYCEMYCKKYGHCFGDPGDCIFEKEIAMYDALKSIEGIVPFDRLLELALADKEERLVALPCKVGDTVWFVRPLDSKKEITETTIEKMVVKGSGVYMKLACNAMYETSCNSIGKTVFLTREEAEAALAGERKDGEG